MDDFRQQYIAQVQKTEYLSRQFFDNMSVLDDDFPLDWTVPEYHGYILALSKYEHEDTLRFVMDLAEMNVKYAMGAIIGIGMAKLVKEAAI